MTTYRMSDNTIVKTENATKIDVEQSDWDGNNHVGRSSGSQWGSQTLYRSRKGRYWIECLQGSRRGAEWVSNEEAARWCLHNDIELPTDLKALEDQITE